MDAETNSPGQRRPAERLLGTVGPQPRPSGSRETFTANRAWWDADADEYQREHGRFLGDVDFVWCPENVREQEARLLGAVDGAGVVEIGCGAAACSRWLATQGALPVGVDSSAGMLRHAAAGNTRTGVTVPLLHADAARLPLASNSMDLACSAFGAIPFVADLGAVLREIHRVLRPGGRWVFAVSHPMRWIFPDDPGHDGLVAVHPYFDRTPYVEVDAAGRATYVEHHRTVGDFVRELTDTGFALDDLVEPEWPEGMTEVWGQWSPLRGRLFPGTAIFLCRSSGRGQP